MTEPTAAEPVSTRTARICPACAQRFSSDARFCPFDGEPLTESARYDPTADPLQGRVIDDRYEILDLIGEGGMGSVYRARHVRLGRSFALKALKRELSVDPELSARFIREAKAAAAISHPNVVQISDFGSLPTGQPYFVMELLEGISLSSLVWNDGPLPPVRALKIAREIAQGLAAAHEAGIIHRDLKPDNVHVGRSGDSPVKVLDFGLAKVAGGSKLTRQGIVYGTPHYMSPEQASGEGVDPRSDLYALGVVLYEMLTGRVPFEADSYMGVLTKQLYASPSPPSELLAAPGLLPPVEQLVLRCLEKRPSKRFASMAAFVDAVDRLLRRLQATPEPAPALEPRPAPPPRPGRLGAPGRMRLTPPTPRWGGWPVLLAGAGIVAAIGALVYPRDDANPSSSSEGPRLHRSTPPAPAPAPAAASAAPASVAPPRARGSRPAPAPTATSRPRGVQPRSVQPSAGIQERPAGLLRPARPERANLRTPTPSADPSVRRSEPSTPSAAVRSKPPPALGGSEIVDPWAK